MNCRTISIVVAGLGMFVVPAVSARAQTAPDPDSEGADAPARKDAAAGEPAAPPTQVLPQAEPAPAPAPARPTQRFLKEPQFAMFGNFKVTLLNFIEFDAFYDSTQSFQDGFGGNSPIARSVGTNNSQVGTYAGKNGRTNFTARNTQIGLQIEAPELWRIAALGHCRMDFNGQQPGTPQNGTSENAFQNSATARLFHCYGAFKSFFGDPLGVSHTFELLGGLTYSIFGNQPYFFPTSLSFLGIPAEVFTRTTQLRFGYRLGSPYVDVLTQVAVARPPQRNAEIPDLVAASRIMVNHWKGARTIGSVGTKVDAASLGVSGVLRQFKVQEFQTDPVLANKIRAWGVSVDAFIPVIPARDLSKAGNSLSLTGSLTYGTGIGDMWLGITGGVPAQVLPPPAGSTKSPQVDIDPGLALYDLDNNLRTVTWRSFNVGFQYYWPGAGNVWTYGNFNYISSPNLESIVGSVRKVGEISNVFTKERFMSIGTFWAIVPNFQIAAEYANLHQWFLYNPQTTFENGQETNHRVSFATYYVF